MGLGQRLLLFMVQSVSDPFLGLFENLDMALSPVKHIDSRAQKCDMYYFREAGGLHTLLIAVFVMFIRRVPFYNIKSVSSP